MSQAIRSQPLEPRRLEGHGLSYRVGGVEGGEHPPLLLLHGLAGRSGNWHELACHLADRYSMLAPDFPGHGASELGSWASTLAGLAASVRACAAAELDTAPIVVGHSLGGQLALELAASEPGWARALVLISASGISSARPEKSRALTISGRVRPARRFDRFRPWILGNRATRRIAFRGMVSDADALSDAAADELFAGAAAATTSRALAALLGGEPWRSLRGVRVPALVIWGARDALLPVADGVDYARRLGASLRVLADTGHLPIGERPAECARLIDEFATGLGR